MPTYTVELYELHTSTVKVEAGSLAEAIYKANNGEGEALGKDSQYLEPAESYGMSVEEDSELVEELEKMGMKCEDIIPGIRSAQVVD